MKSMNKTAAVIIGIILVLLVAAAAFFAYIWFSGGSDEPSKDISEAVIHIQNVGEGTIFNIVPESSSASFELDEVLNGRDNTVLGTTNQVGGEIVVNFANPQASQIGTIRINARTLETDQAMRNRTLRSNILQSSKDEFEFIDFVPTSLNDVPDVVGLGETFGFNIVGELRIMGQTKTLTFRANVTIDSETQISGTATATIRREDYGIAIPRVPSVADVEEEVLLTLNFVARAAES
jgi:polyisoprenoid-binding protein YceI